METHGLKWSLKQLQCSLPSTYINKKTQNKFTPAVIKLNAPGKVSNVLAYTKLYNGADPKGEIDSIDVVNE